ncbi:hypothetical protein PF005_g24706 [Phytophthora fragariae]|uniref:PA domain-containing protein n=1 Tax=Phytophthora fragariae TaxID=53985 RepID=A0A6A3RE56_9STRA|nr:hypothetical protein PF003_g35327 [Phytophthora fragariae]KAE8924288.1 hypothetical protein PF009_g25476 [Phytophthora fragariae]KAE8977965.1 hypothetical protein PF011_g23437 [Phytophthora fragariae]KAE9075465.1 hypothetical protein PF010_g24290 [Phytophthora fragariae]KAE9076290.1 hypothetical protein PF007_g24678 [Phytophthora fragariae]
MPLDADIASLPAASSAAQEFAFVSWDGSDGRRACPLATFGAREPQTLSVRLACAEPPRADQPELKNAAELRGAIALVVRGGCSFAHKARLLQRAGAVAMLLANNTREESLAAFTMGESPEELNQSKKHGAEPITIPCVMMCLKDVRELFQKFPPSVKTGVLSFEILQSDDAVGVAEECLRLQRERHEAAEAGKGWKAIKRTTTSIIKMLEPQNSTSPGMNAPPITSGQDGDVKPEECTEDASPLESQAPLLAFVQWASSASTYEICFAPLADFCSARAGASYSGKLVASDPLLADGPLINTEQLSGAVALMRRGSCSFPEKLERAQRAGAVAAIVCNDDEEDLDAAFVMSVDHIDTSNATIPAVMISHNSFLRIQSALNTTAARILCLSGEAADGLLASSGKSVSFKALPMPTPRQSSGKDEENDALPVFDPLFDLHVACRDGDHAACQRVLAAIEGKDAKWKLVSARCPTNGLAALHHACAAGNDNVVELLLKLGAVPDTVDLALQTPLHIACANGNVECARLLLRAEASTPQVPTVLYNVDEEYGGLATMRTIGGGTAMHEAASAGSPECVELLLTANARMDSAMGGATDKYVFLGVSAKDLEGSTPLHVACESAHAECALYLMAANADVKSKDSNGRSPLLLACEAANDPAKESDAVQIIEKLISLGAAMDELDEDGRLSSVRLLLDRVQSPDLRRELEVLYLRHEARCAQQSNRELREKNEAAIHRMRNLEDEVSALRSQVKDHENYGFQLQQLQLQMQMILQFQSSYGMRPPSSFTKHTVETPLLDTSLSDPAGKSDEELALDAALARDLGKKCLRQNQSVLAEKYFLRSLELMPLPGVHRLLDAARQNQHIERENGEVSEHPLTSNPHTSFSSKVLAPTSTKQVKIKSLREQVQAAQAAPQARIMLENELDKLEALSDGDELALACRWMEWLVALPWGDPCSGLQTAVLYDVKRSEFQQLDAMDSKRAEACRRHAARIIQRTFRERFAIHLRTRAVAATRIQAIGKGKLARLHYKSTKQQLMADRDRRVTQSANQQDGSMFETPSQLDYATAVDPAIHRKLPQEFLVEELVVGTRFPKQQLSGGKSDGRDKPSRVLQLVKCSDVGSTLRWKSKATESRSSFFVWTRWGSDLDKRCECSLSGPYEDLQDAQRRYDRITREADSREMLEEDFPQEVDTAYESGFDFLRSTARVGELTGRTASA